MSVSRAQPGRESWVWAPDRRGQPVGVSVAAPNARVSTRRQVRAGDVPTGS